MHSGCNSCPEKESRIVLAIKDATMGFVCLGLLTSLALLAKWILVNLGPWVLMIVPAVGLCWFVGYLIRMWDTL